MKREALGPAAELVREEERLLACVHCGFCLTACPTYTRLGDEADSPRGRLLLMRAVAEGRLETSDPAFHTHIDRCLGCRACEPVCPSGVQYGFLLERARAVIARERGTHGLGRLLLDTFGSRTRTMLVSAPGRLLRAMGVAAMLAKALPARWAHLRMALAMLAATRPWRGLRRAGARAAAPAADAPGPGAVAHAEAGQDREVAEPHARMGGLATGTAVGRPAHPSAPARPVVAMLEGCVQRGLFGHVNEATTRVLRANGCDLVPAPGQGCCGALHAHAGDLDGARRLARANIEAFERSGAQLVAVNAAGCGAIMKEYGAQFEDDTELGGRAASLSARVRDISELLVELGPRVGGPLPLRVTFDAPCHLLHAQRIAWAPLDVLAAVPALEIVPLPGSEDCCGGAGIYGIEHPELGGRILADKLDAIRSTGADAVLTPNPGCIMQIGSGLLLRGDATPVLHPIELLDESYRRARM